MGARRKPDARWAVSFSTLVRSGTGPWAADPELAGAPEPELRQRLRTVDGVRYRWRYDAKQRSITFELPAEADAAVTFRQTLVAAMAGEWPADERGRPVRPDAAGAPTEPGRRDVSVSVDAESSPRTADADGGPTPGLATVTALHPATRPPPVPTAHGNGVRLPTAQGDWADLEEVAVHASNFGELCAWRMDELVRLRSKRKLKRAGSTLGNFEGELAFAAGFFRYQPGDARIDDEDVSAGASMRFDHPAGITEADCCAYLEERKHTNLRTRAANLQAERQWAKEIEGADRAAQRTNTAMVLPAPPELEAEVATPRTIEAAANTVRSALRDAQAEGVIVTNPWTPRVDKRIEGVPPVHFSEKLLPNPLHVTAMADAMAAHRRDGYIGRVAQELDGGRYRGMVLLDYEGLLRPEEVIALRLSWLILDGPHPGIVVEGGEVSYPLRFSATGVSRTFVTLKQRQQGDTRFVPLTTEAVVALRDHLAAYVPAPDATSDDPEAQDPRLFTTHNGKPIDLGTFAEKWWRPVLARLFAEPGQAHLAGLQFRQLRHARITALLRDGNHYEDVATWAGNSPQVIRSSYRGVIDRMGPATRERHPQGAALHEMLAPFAAELAGLSDADATERVADKFGPLGTGALVALGRAMARHGRDRMNQEDI